MTKHIIVALLKRFNIRMRCRQRNKKLPKEAYRNDLAKWRLISTGLNDSYNEKWGRFLLNRRFNVDHKTHL